MLAPLLLALVVLPPQDREFVGPSTLSAEEPPVRIWLNGDRRFEPGQSARVQVEARDDGYLLVFNFDTDGRIRVLFPLDPSDDGFVRGGRRYEVRTERDRASFAVGDAGSGFVYVALAPDPWRIRDWVRGNTWDYDQVAIDPQSNDPERDLTRLAESVSSDRGFDYDIIEYFVDNVEVVRYEYQPGYFTGPGIYSFDPVCDPYWSSGWYCGGRSGAIVSYGRRYGSSWWSIGYGPSWYWPGHYGYYYNDYAYGRGASYYSYYRPWIVTGPTYRPGNNGVFLSGRSRDYGVGRTTSGGFGNSALGGRTAASPGDSYRARPASDGRARPVTERPAAVPESRGRPAVDRSRDGGADRGRPDAGSGGAQPAGRPSSGRPSTQGSPSAGRPPSSQPARARPRGGNESEFTDSRSAGSGPPEVRGTGRAPVSTEAGRGSAPRVPQAEPGRREAPPAPSARSAPPRASAPARAEPRNSPPPKPSASRAQPPARSRTRPPAQ